LQSNKFCLTARFVAMLSPKTQTNLANAQSYFDEHLCVGDYYSDSERVRGEWLGISAAQLGLSGVVEQAQFMALCENRNPQSGERLTVRKKTTRRDGAHEVANRRVFYDFTLSPPKSVSVAALVGGDERILVAHGAAVRVAIRELEQFAATQVHKGVEHLDRRTSNFVAALFQHDTSRALDPHLHTHCIVFNATHDPQEQRWKALHNHAMLSAQKFVENVYYHELASKLRDFGYTVVNKARGDFELAEVSASVRECFSKRHREIDAKTAELLAAHTEKSAGNIADIREHIAHKHRSRKLPSLPKEQLREFWLSQLPSEALGDAPQKPQAPEIVTVADAVDWAEEHLFERCSIVSEHEIWRHALARGRGDSFSIRELKTETANRDYLRTKEGQITRRDVLTREWNIVEMARTGSGTCPPFTASDLWKRDDLAPDQQTAFARILSSRDFVTLFRGGAGTGKSHVLRRVQDALTASAQTTVTLAPQRQQVLDLERDGLTGCQTVSEFLQRGEVSRGAVIIVDEAGQIGGRQMHALLTLAWQSGSRVILSGDTRQHGPVEASDALRAIERYAGIRSAELNSIRRQEPARGKTTSERDSIAAYRAAVKAASEGDFATSFEVLDALGAVIECSEMDRSAKLVESFLALAAHDESAIVVSQTRAEVAELNARIRSGLRQGGKLVGAERTLQTLEAVDLTNAQKADPRFYPENAVAIVRQAKGSEIGKVVATTAAGVVVEANGKLRKLRTADLDRLTICSPNEIAVGKGDQLQIKANAPSSEGKKLANGEIVTVVRVFKNGDIALEDGRTIPPTFRQFTRGYAVTSYGSQGKTVEHVLFSDSASRAATNAEQWYVTISRGRKSIRIVTPDKAALAANITRTGNRELALDAFPHPKRKMKNSLLLRGIKRGRELARRLCAQVSARWKPTANQKQRTALST
jgi:conjugative relaxase-like TrwC/TraI family protein